jgi:DNA-binding NarL/FixJ family response regulator
VAVPIRVVVIDDDADFLWLIRFRLRVEHDITVIGEAEDGETGVVLALREQPDIVALDLMMPRIAMDSRLLSRSSEADLQWSISSPGDPFSRRKEG